MEEHDVTSLAKEPEGTDVMINVSGRMEPRLSLEGEHHITIEAAIEYGNYGPRYKELYLLAKCTDDNCHWSCRVNGPHRPVDFVRLELNHNGAT